MAKKNLCGIEIEYSEGKEFHHEMFHCYGATSVDGKACPNDDNNFVTIESKDGTRAKVIAMCPQFEDAKAIVCAMSLAKELMDANVLNIKDLIKYAKSDINEKLRMDGYNVKAMEAKMDELLKSGKSIDDILKYMTEHREDFIIKKHDDEPTNDNKERW